EVDLVGARAGSIADDAHVAAVVAIKVADARAAVVRDLVGLAEGAVCAPALATVVGMEDETAFVGRVRLRDPRLARAGTDVTAVRFTGVGSKASVRRTFSTSRAGSLPVTAAIAWAA